MKRSEHSMLLRKFIVIVLMYFAAANAKPNMTPPSTNNPNTISFRNWKEHESHCGGEHQSPINIESNQASIANYPEFIFHNYDLVFPERLVNNGHTDEQFDNIINPSTTNSDALKYSVPLSDLLPDSTESFFRYNGSLTTGDCNEDVIWTVFDTPIAISERQLAKFRLLHDDNGNELIQRTFVQLSCCTIELLRTVQIQIRQVHSFHLKTFSHR